MDELDALRELRPDADPLRPHARHAARSVLRFEIGYESRPRPRTGRLAACVATCVLVAAAFAVAVLDDRISPTRVAGSDPPALGTGIPRGDQFLYTREVLIETQADGVRERFVDESWQSVSGMWPSRESERGRTWTRAPAEHVWPPRSYEELDRLPTDPRALRRSVAGDGGDQLAYPYLMMLLRGWRVMPPGLRTATFEAIRRIPGVRVTPGGTDARGRRGLLVSRPGDRMDVRYVVDPSTYEYLGIRDTFVRDDGVTVERVSALTGHGVVDRVGQRP